MVPRREHGAYRNPPIEEAIVQFQFAPDRPWDAALAGKLQQHRLLADAYTATPARRDLIEVGIQFTPTQLTNVAHRTINPHIMLRSEDSHHVITVGDYVIGLSTLKPYDGWDQVRRRIEDAMTALRETLRDSESRAISRIGVRYINRIEIPFEPDDGLDIDAYFHCGPRQHASLPPFSEFLYRTVSTHGDGVKLATTFAPYPGGSSVNRAAFLLDIDAARSYSDSRPFEVAWSIEEAESFHRYVSQVFEASITDHTREVLDAIRT